MTISVPVQGYANSPSFSTDTNIKWIIIGAVVIAVIIAAALIFRKK